MCPLQYEWLVREKVADGALISKWRKPGYEILCSMLAIQKGNHNFGTTSHCRSVHIPRLSCTSYLELSLLTSSHDMSRAPYGVPGVSTPDCACHLEVKHALVMII